MKITKLIACALTLVSVTAFGTTPSPVSTLNTAGSTAGQAIVSPGPAGPAGWGNVSAAALTGITPAVNGGTNCGTASGTCLDNITGFSATGFLTRTGAGTYAFQSATNGITLGNLAQVAANTVLSNATGSTANLVAFSMPSCSTSVSAINWTPGTGWTCNTGLITAATAASTYATIAQATTAFAATGGSINGVTVGQSTPLAGSFTTLSATSTVTVPSGTTFNQPNIVASTTGTAAASGSVGFYQTANTAAASASSGIPLNVASASLSAGVWDVQCTGQFISAGSTIQQVAEIGVSTTSATFGAYPTTTTSAGTTTAGFQQVFSSPRVPLSLTTTTTVFCVAQSNFSTSTLQIAGTIGAWLRH